MIIIPAIDLRAQRVVRLLQGDFAQQQTYANDPVELARTYRDQGAQWLHVVDLDGAKTGSTENLAVIERMVATGLRVQAGGGVRSRAQLDAFLKAGVERVVVGSLAVKQPQLVAQWFDEFGAERLTLALDARADAGGVFRIATAGWTELETADLESTTAAWLAKGARHFLVTDIDRDGMLGGPNVALYRSLAARFANAHLVASGGVHALADLRALRAAGAAAVVIGKALLDGRFGVPDALHQAE